MWKGKTEETEVGHEKKIRKENDKGMKGKEEEDRRKEEDGKQAGRKSKRKSKTGIRGRRK